jgi:hypothetical protein
MGLCRNERQSHHAKKCRKLIAFTTQLLAFRDKANQNSPPNRGKAKIKFSDFWHLLVRRLGNNKKAQSRKQSRL